MRGRVRERERAKEEGESGRQRGRETVGTLQTFQIPELTVCSTTFPDVSSFWGLFHVPLLISVQFLLTPPVTKSALRYDE